MSVGIFPANVSQVAASNGFAGGGRRVPAPGWLKIIQGTGPLTSITVGNATVVGYGNGAIGRLQNSAGNAVSANVRITSTNSTGGTLVLSIDNAGNNFMNTAALAIVGFANSLLKVNTSVGGSGYVNGDVLTFSNGVINATAQVLTNSTGGILAWDAANTANSGVQFVSPGYNGSGFTGVAAEVAIAFTTKANSISTLKITNATGGATRSDSAFVNGDVVTASNVAGGAVNATFTVGTNTVGGITSFTLVTSGRLFNGVNTGALFAVANSTGGASLGTLAGSVISANQFGGISGSIVANTTSFAAGGNAVFSVVLGGRAQRVQYECLAEVSSMTGALGAAFPYSA